MKLLRYLIENVWRYFEKITDMPFYDDMMDNPEYYKRVKKLESRVVMMKPYDYLKACGEVHGSSAQRQIDLVDMDRAEQLLKAIKEKHTKMKLPVMDYAYKTQEGRHRAVISMKLGLETMPVLVVNKI